MLVLFVPGITVGHDHQNDWACPYASMYLMYGRHSGYGGYSNLPRGSRIFNLRLDDIARQKVAIDTYIRMEAGQKLSSITI